MVENDRVDVTEDAVPGPPAVQPPRRLDRANALRIGALALIWGCSFLFIKVGLAGLSATQVVLARLVAGAVTLLAVAALRREPLPRRPRVWGHLLVAGVFANVLPFYAFAWGEAHGAPSSLAGVYNASTPLFTMLVALVVLPSERPGPGRLAGLLTGFGGVLLVLAPWHPAAGARLSGQLACLAAAACYGLSFVYMRRFLAGRGASPLTLATGQLCCATLTLLVLAPAVASGPVRLAPKVVASMLALGALGTGIAYVLNYSLIRDVGATTASTTTYLIPVVAVTLGVVALGEPFGWHDLVGAIVVVAGVALAEGRRPAGRRWALAGRRRTLGPQQRGSSSGSG